MSGERNYAYGQGDEQATDAYVNDIAGSREEPPPYSNFDIDERTRDSMPTQKQVYPNKWSRYFVMGVSVLLCLAGLATISLAKVQQTKNILPLCPNCNDLITAMYAFGGALMLFSMVGIAASITCIRGVAYLFAALLVLLGLVFCAGGFAVVAFDTNMKSSDIQTLWDDAVSHKYGFICDLQGTFNCSGFSESCISNHTLSSTSEQCMMTCVSSNNNTEPCQTKIEAEVKHYLIPLIGVTFGVALVMFLTAITSVRMTLQ